MQRSHEVLEFWFGRLDAVDDGDVPEVQLGMWFAADEETDDEIRRRFSDDLDRAACGDYDHWTDDPREHLALILLLDQFSRNIYRGTPRAFAFDEQALTYALDAIDRDHDQAVAPVARAFFYLPLEHVEELGHQQRCVELMTEVLEEAPEDQRELFEGFLRYAKDHHKLIERFGRFPHRNEILGRESTPEELAYLEDGGATYGQSAG